MHAISSYFKKQLRNLNRKASDNKGQFRTDQAEAEEESSLDTAGRLRPYAILNNTAGQLEDFQSFMAASLNLQLELIRRTLNLTTAAFLWAPAASDQLNLLAISSARYDLVSGPFPKGAGLIGALLKSRNVVTIEHASNKYAGLIYYENPGGVGSAIALRSIVPDMVGQDLSDSFFALCVDRLAPGPWTDDERALLQLAANKMVMERKFAKLLNTIDQERSIIQKICTGFRELNRGLGLESVFQATANAVNNLLPVNCIAISLVKKGIHYTAFISGGLHEQFLGMEYEIHEGLVGQVLKLNHSLPANASYAGDAPVFSSAHYLHGYKSLFIIPLRPEKGRPIGALTVAAKAEHLFGKQQQDILSLIADQAAIKIDLAKSHELINKMATTDGLTSLANHRTFQHGFDIMLHRAKRRKSPLAMILCDIDHFKKVNDNYGHQFGDQVLKSVAGSMAKAIRKEDLAARYGGEEFALVLENSDKKGALLMAERIRNDIAALKFSFEGRQKVGVTISLGIAAFPEDGHEKTQIIELADQALYKAKKQGHNQTVLCLNG